MWLLFLNGDSSACSGGGVSWRAGDGPGWAFARPWELGAGTRTRGRAFQAAGLRRRVVLLSDPAEGWAVLRQAAQ